MLRTQCEEYRSITGFVKPSTCSVTSGRLLTSLSGWSSLYHLSFFIGLCDLGSGRSLLGKIEKAQFPSWATCLNSVAGSPCCIVSHRRLCSAGGRAQSQKATARLPAWAPSTDLSPGLSVA